MMPCRRAIRCAMRIEDVSSEPRSTASTTLTAATTSAASSAQPKLSTVSTPSVRASVDEEDARVRDQHEQEAEDERERQPQRGEHRRDDRVQRRHDRRDEQRAPEARRCGHRAGSRRPPSTRRPWRATRRRAGTAAAWVVRAARRSTGRTGAPGSASHVVSSPVADSAFSACATFCSVTLGIWRDLGSSVVDPRPRAFQSTRPSRWSHARAGVPFTTWTMPCPTPPASLLQAPIMSAHSPPSFREGAIGMASEYKEPWTGWISFRRLRDHHRRRNEHATGTRSDLQGRVRRRDRRRASRSST